MDTTIKIKPMSVNRAFQGRRFKSRDYKAYEEEFLYLLPSLDISDDKQLRVRLEFGMSNAGMDIDNPIKPVLDILQKKYGFNDNQIYELHIFKVKTKKGEEYVKFSIEEL